MKVAVVVNTSWNIFNFRMSLVKAFLGKGHEVHTIAPEDEYTQRLRDIGCVHHNIRMDSRGANPIKDLALIFEFKSIYEKVKPDVILHFTVKPNVYGTLAAAMLKIPVINNVCGLGTAFLKRGMVLKIARMLYKISFRFARKVFFQNEDDLHLFVADRLVGFDKAEVLPGSGININDFKPESFKQKEPFTFLAVSRLIYDKGISEYIDAIKILRKYGVKARFQLLGAKDPDHMRGIPIRKLQEWIDSGLVEYFGKADSVIPFMNSADCILLPSYREGSPRSLMEAACLQKPLITTNVPGCKQVVEDNYNGFLCEVQDAEDLAVAMGRMMQLTERERLQMGINGRKKMEKEFSDSIVIRKYFAAIDSIFSDELSLEWIKLAS